VANGPKDLQSYRREKDETAASWEDLTVGGLKKKLPPGEIKNLSKSTRGRGEGEANLQCGNLLEERKRKKTKNPEAQKGATKNTEAIIA